MNKWSWFAIAIDVAVIAALGWTGVVAVLLAHLAFYWINGRRRGEAIKDSRRWLADKVAPKQIFLVKGQRYVGVPLTVPPGSEGVTIRNNTVR